MSEEVNATPVDDGLVVNTGTEATTEPAKAADLAPASATEHDKKPVEADLSEGAQKAINKKHWEAKEAERKATTLQARVDELEALQRQTPASEAVNVPEMPDPYSDDFQQQIQARDDAIRHNAGIDADKRFNTQQQQNQQDEAQRQQVASAEQARQSYLGKAAERGFDAEEVSKAAADIVNYGVSDAVAEMLLTEADGADMTMYLRQNPADLQNMQSMPLHAQISHMNNVVRIGAESLKPKTSNAPPPPTDISAGGPLAEVDPLLEGLTINI
jgi:hypothetical protein